MLLTIFSNDTSLLTGPVVTLGLAGWASNLLTLGFLFICVVLILIVLIQRPQGGGLSGAFGSGAGSGQTAFGAKTGDALTFATIGIFILFLLAAIGLNFAARPTTAQQDQPQAATPAETGSVGSPADAETASDPDTSDTAETGSIGDAESTDADASAPADESAPEPTPTGDGG